MCTLEVVVGISVVQRACAKTRATEQNDANYTDAVQCTG